MKLFSLLFEYYFLYMQFINKINRPKYFPASDRVMKNIKILIHFFSLQQLIYFFKYTPI